MATGFHEDIEKEVVKNTESIDACNQNETRKKSGSNAQRSQSILVFDNFEEGDKHIRLANMLRMELRERKIKIVQAMDVAGRNQHNNLGYVKARQHETQQIELRRVKLDLKKKTVVVGGQITAKTCENGSPKYNQYHNIEKDVEIAWKNG